MSVESPTLVVGEVQAVTDEGAVKIFVLRLDPPASWTLDTPSGHSLEFLRTIMKLPDTAKLIVDITPQTT